MMMGLVVSLSGILSVSLPMLIELLMQHYGFRGCMAVLGALNLHVLLAMIAMIPVDLNPQVDSQIFEEIDQTSIQLEVPTIDSSPKKGIWYSLQSYFFPSKNFIL